ncbi:MAG TPA: VOC family protein [Planctomycetota bacterium]|nr:VOC family protein [Planctomycetota bacterium]
MSDNHKPAMAAAVFYDDAPAAIDWLNEAFGFEVMLKVEGAPGKIAHSELDVFGSMLMVASADCKPMRKSPRSIGGVNTQTLAISVGDVDAHFERARKVGAKIIQQPTTNDYGDDYGILRGYEAEDPEGHRWYFSQKLTRS